MLALRPARSALWAWLAMGVTAMLAVPIAAVLSSLAVPAGEVWLHLWRTQLLELIANTLLLLLGVGVGTLIVGGGLAWLVVHHRFPGRAALEWALILPLAIPAYVIGFTFLGLFEYSGPLQTALRAALGEGSRLPELRSPGGVVLMMTLIDQLSEITSAYLLVIGVVLIALVLWFPKGILGSIGERWLPWLM